MHLIFKIIFKEDLLIFVLYEDVVSALDKVASNDKLVHKIEVILNVEFVT